MILTLGFSPCPNDTFIFNALVNGPVANANLQYKCTIADVEELNRLAITGTPDVCKISMALYPQIAKNYIILNSGSALGINNGPLLISKSPEPVKPIEELKIAIPGIHTTANLLLSIAFPNAANKTEMLFSDIEQAVLNGAADAGLIIHESRFTYREKGLHKIIDFGHYWDQHFNQLLPLGCIVAKRALGNKMLQFISNSIKESVSYAFKNPNHAKSFIKLHAREMNDSVIEQHIKLYVNEYTIDLGEKGRNAINFLLVKGAETGFLPKTELPIFLEP